MYTEPDSSSIISQGDENHEETVVIIGAGSIGLSIAYHLALDSKETASRKRIIVLDTLNKTFGATSGSCTGCLHYEFRESEGDKLIELGKYSFEIWKSLSEEDKFRTAVGYRPQCFFEMNPGRGQGLDELPDWFQPNHSWDTDEEELQTPTAIVNPKGVGEWLASECLRLGVDIRLSVTATSAHLSSSNVIQSVTYESDGVETQLQCQALVVAAGPWTPTVYHTLFPASSIRLRSDLNAGDWILFRNPFPVTEKSIAFIALDAIVGEKLEFTGRDDGTIWLIGRKDHNATLPPLGEFASPDEAMIEELIGRAKQHLRHAISGGGRTSGTLEIVAKGRAIRPAANTLLPIISGVDAKNLGDTDIASSGNSGVFVSWGHGSYGLTLGMGTGKIMSQIICGEQPDIDISPFDISRDRF